MANIKLIFSGTERSGTNHSELTSNVNEQNEIYIEIESEYNQQSAHIVLDSETAKYFYLQLKQQVEQICPF